jgi:hypothetical protein
MQRFLLAQCAAMSEPLRFHFIPMPEWPVLAWLACVAPDDPAVTVLHGTQVETRPEWFCEAVWPAPFEEGGFDRTDLVAGSGARLRNGALTFVSAGNTVDRLQSIATNGAVCVSNSLACLMVAAGARVPAASGRYFWMFRTIVGGIARYRRRFPTTAGDVQLTYFDNLLWDGRTMKTVAKPGRGRDFSTFENYARFLEESVLALAANAASPARAHRYELLTTASSGYDSSTITVLAKRAGATKVLCFDQARRGLDDSGEPLARHLGMQPIVVPRSAWADTTLPEPPFLAADSNGGDVFFKGAEEILRGTVLLTGYHGDKMWAKESPSANENIVRGDQSGLSLTEYRLSTGTIHCPITFWGVRQIADLHRISTAPEMKPWDVPGDYSRPICRRIVENAGVPREMFGRTKKASWVLLVRNRSFLSKPSLADYLAWSRSRQAEWLRKGLVPPHLVRRFDRIELAIRRTCGRISAIDEGKWFMRPLHRTGAIRVLWRLVEGPTYLRRFLFPWALDRQMQKYAGASAWAASRRARDAYAPTPSSPPEATSPGRAWA